MSKKIFFVFFSILLITGSGLAQETYNIPLKAGDNLIGLPFTPQDKNIASILSPIISQVKDVWEFNPSDTSDPWKHYRPGLEEYSDLKQMDAGKGYWINLKSNTTLQITGTAVPENSLLNLKTGWNVLGWPYQYSQGITAALAGLAFGTDYTQVSGFNSATKAQENFLNQQASDDFTDFQPGKAYYLYMLQDKTIQIGLSGPADTDWISNLSCAPNAFSPNNDGQYDTTTISYLITKDAQVTVKLYDANNTLIRTLKDNLLETSGTHTAIWDGKDNSGNLVSDGTYTYKIGATDTSGNPAQEQQGTVTIDYYVMDILQPTPGATLANEVTFKIRFSCATGVYSGLNFYYRLKGTTEWTYLGWYFQDVSGDYQFSWDSRSVANGLYEFKFDISYYDLNNDFRIESSYPIEYRVENGLYISNLSASPDVFSPNNDNQYDTTTITYLITKEAQVTLKLYDAYNTLIRTLKDNLLETSGTHTAIWDGKDNEGNLVSYGIYTYKINATDTSGNPAQEQQGTVIVDYHILDILQPTPGATLANEVTFKIRFSSTTGVYSGLSSYYRLKGTTEWTSLKWCLYDVQDGFQFSWNTRTVPNGTYELKFDISYFALDKQWRYWESTYPVEYRVENGLYISNFSCAPNAFSPNGDGQYDTTTINYLITRDARVTVKLYDAGNTLIRTLKDSLLETPGTHTAVWDGKDDAGNLVSGGTYTYKINAIDIQGNPAQEQQGTVTIDYYILDILTPTQGTALANEVTFKARLSSGTFSYYTYTDPRFYYRAKGSSQWIYLGIATKNAQGDWLFSWNTRTISNGLYEFKFDVSYYDLNKQWRYWEPTYPVEYRVENGLYISNLSASPDVFSPNDDGQYDTTTISYLINKEAQVSVKLYDANNTLIRTLKDNLLETSGTRTAIWDGKDDAGNFVSYGIYTYKINATDTQGNPAQEQQAIVTVDTVSPLTEITSPQENDTIGSKITILGTASDNNLADYKVEYSEGDSYVVWNPINISSSSVTNGVLAEWDSGEVNNGVYIFRLTAADIAGNISTAQVKVRVDNIKITDISFNPDYFNPSNNENTNIKYTLDRNADITIKIYDLDNNLIRTLINSQPRNLGANTEAWDGRGDDGQTIVPVNAYTIAIEAQSGSSRGEYQSSGGFVHNAVIATDFNVAQNFNPYNNELCRIEYTLPDNALFLLQAGKDEEFLGYISVVDWQPRAKGHYFEYWDGRDRKGDMLDYYTTYFPLIVGYQTQSLPENSVVVTGPQPGSVDVLADPYAFMPAFGDFTNITYTLPASGNVSLSVREPSGKLIKSLLNNEFKTTGSYTLAWDGRDASGKLISRDDNYMIKVEFTGLDGRTITRYGNITTR